MSEEITAQEIEEALALIRSPSNTKPGKFLVPSAEEFAKFFRPWVREFRVQAGSTLGVIPSVLYRHWVVWLASKGYEPPEVSATGWGRALKSLAFTKGKEKDLHPLLMTTSAARYFRLWAAENPGPCPWPECIAPRKKNRSLEPTPEL